MRRLALILQPQGDLNAKDSVRQFWLDRLPELFPSLESVVERSRLGRIRPVEPALTPEARYLGLEPELVAMEDGPLVIAAYGAEPPDRSWQFHLSLFGLVDGVICQPEALTVQEIQTIVDVLPKLNTSALTFVKGWGLDHGLVFEGRMDLGTTAPEKALGKELRTVLPDGDGEGVLRRFIDDAVNMLGELEFNRIRQLEDRSPVSVAWPWGGGWRTKVPHLALKRGEVVKVFASSLRVLGLAKLVGYRPVWCASHQIPNELLDGGSGVWVWEPRAMESDSSEFDEGYVEHRFRDVDHRLLDPLIRDSALANLTVLIAPGELQSGDRPGLALHYEPKIDERQRLPFDSRALEERSLPSSNFEKWMAEWYLDTSISGTSFSGSGFGSL